MCNVRTLQGRSTSRARGRPVNRDLVDRARTGDHDAFAQLARQNIDRLYAIAQRVLRDAESAEDAVQECLFHAWRDLRVLRDAERFEAWLYRLLLNACRDEQRRRQRRPAPIAMTVIEPRFHRDDVAEVDRRDELERGFRKLTPEHRMVLVLHHLRGLRAREIADLLGIPEGTVISRLHYGGRALRHAIEPAAAPSGSGIGDRS